jgi:hypothetical protein
MIDNQLIEQVKQYRYLGVMINASGSFSDAPSAVSERRTMSSVYNKQFNLRELGVTGLQVWSKISGRSLINCLSRLWLRLTLDEHKCWKKMNQLHFKTHFYMNTYLYYKSVRTCRNIYYVRIYTFY